MKIKLKFAIFALFVATLLCSCGGGKVKYQLPPLIELKTPEKPLDVKYFKYSLNEDGHVAISAIDWKAVIKDDVFENILIPATIEGIPVDSVKISLFSDKPDFEQNELNEDVRKKRLLDFASYEKDKYSTDQFFCQRIEFEEGIKEIELKSSRYGCYVSYDYYSADDKKTYHKEKVSYDGFGKKYYDGDNVENLEYKGFGLREIVFHKGQKKITGNFGTIALERLVLPEDLENIEFTIKEPYGLDMEYCVNCPLTEIVWPKSDFKITSEFFTGLDFTKMDTLVLPDSLKEISGYSFTAFPYMKVQKIVLPKKLNFIAGNPTMRADDCEINEIEIPADAVITTRANVYSSFSHKLEGREWDRVCLPRGLKKITFGENSTSDPFIYPSSLEEIDIADSAKINFAWASANKYSSYDAKNVFYGCEKLSLATQAKLKEKGYEGSF